MQNVDESIHDWVGRFVLIGVLGYWIEFFVGIAVLVLVRIVILRMAERWAVKRSWNPALFRSMINWLAVYILLVWILSKLPGVNVLNAQLFPIGKQQITPMRIIVALVIITLGLKLSQLITRYVMQPGLRRYHLDSGLQYALTRMTQYIIVTLALVIAFVNMGIDLSALTVLAGVAGVGIGIGLQNITSNFFSGMVLLFERPFKIGDIVKVGAMICEVEGIQMRATIVRSLDHERIIIPNSYLIENQIVNLSYGDETMRIPIPVGVAYGSDTDLVRDLLLQAADETDLILKKPPSRVEFLEFGDSSLNFRLLVWVDKPLHRFQAVSDINFAINRLFADRGVEIPFPQRDLHLRSVDGKVLDQLRDLSTRDS